MSVVSPEGKVKLYIKKFMKAHYPNAWQYCPMGGPFGKSGAPDFLYLIEGVLIGIEAKADKGRLSELQAQTLKQMAAQGALCAVVYGKDEDKMMRIKAAIDAEVEKRFGAQNVAAVAV